MAADPRIGTRNPDGTLDYPAQTLGGRPFVRTSNPPTIINIDARHFVVRDLFPAYDVRAAVEALRKPATRSIKRVEPEPESEGTDQ